MCRIPFFRIPDRSSPDTGQKINHNQIPNSNRIPDINQILVDPNYFFVRNTTFLARQYNWSNMFNTITTCRLSHYFRLKTCSSFLSQSSFPFDVCNKICQVLSGKYPANFTRIPDSAGCLHFTGYQIVLSGSGTSLLFWFVYFYTSISFQNSETKITVDLDKISGEIFCVI